MPDIWFQSCVRLSLSRPLAFQFQAHPAPTHCLVTLDSSIAHACCQLAPAGERTLITATASQREGEPCRWGGYATS